MSAASRYASKVRSRNRARQERAGNGLFGLGYTWDDGPDARLGVLQELAEDFSLGWPEIGQVWAQRQREVFATGSSGRWAPLAAQTILKQRASAVGDPTAILVDTGLLRDDLTRPEPRSSGPRFAVYGPPTGSISPYYARFHVNGSGNPQRHPVPRFSPSERQRVAGMMRQFVRTAADL